MVFLMGPTAAGKTALAISLVARLPLDIVSVDSAMVYRHLDIGTGKPPPEVLARAPHRLVDVRDPDASYSAAAFRDDARRAIDEIHGLGRIPLLVGGTMLYFRALASGLSPLPGASPALRERLSAEAAREGSRTMHARLAGVDPRAAARIHPNDPQRIQRALEVFESSGRPMSEWLEEAPPDALEHRVVRIVLDPPDRGALHAAIADRFHAMVDAGLADEVEGLRARFALSERSASMRAVGYRQAWSHVVGEIDRNTMIERGIVATRQLARRQLTWLRAEPRDLSVDGGATGSLDRVSEFLAVRLG